ncbi:hypothetical protein BC829DRAFT_494258 [Chytridium lagenaria]|nr:hypothetical protein BC829DRAFT_494258 [Chytridium lagenaria]
MPKKQFSKPQQSTLLEPGYCLVCSASSNPRLVFINIAKSLKIAAPPKDDPLNIPNVFIKSDHARVIDCIVNNSVFADCEKDSKFKRDIIDLALQSVQEAEIKELQLNVNNLLKNHYRVLSAGTILGSLLTKKKSRRNWKQKVHRILLLVEMTGFEIRLR